MTLRVAVVGLGYFSQFHLRAWREIEDIEIVGIADPIHERRLAAEQTYGVRSFGDIYDLLKVVDPDIVDIVTPPSTHAVLTRAALKPQRIIVGQKPFCGDWKAASAIARQARDAGSTIVVHENFRFQPWHREIKRLLSSGELGVPLQAWFLLRPGDGRNQDAYLGRQPAFRSMPRFLIYETAVHFLDLFRYFFGDIATVYADMRRLNPAIVGEDAAYVLLEHENGTRAVFDGNRLLDHISDNPRRTMGEMYIEGEKATLRLDGYGRIFIRPFGSVEETLVLGANSNPEFGGGCVALLNRHITDHIRIGTRLENTVENYLPVLRASEAAYASAQNRRQVSLREEKGQ